MKGDFEALRARDPKRAAAVAASLRKYIVQPHSGGQREVLACQARFQTLCAGRRWGKTKIGAKRALRECRKPDRVVWWVANTYKNVRRGYREVLRQTPPSVLAKPAPPATADGRLILHFKNGTRMEFYSAENPDAMVGEGVAFVVIDEAALCREANWTQVIRPTLIDTRGSALLISTPRGHNWFKTMFDRGQEDEREQYMSWRFPTWTNPYIAASEIDDMREDYPAVLWEQEVAAEFISNAASVFRFDENLALPYVDTPKDHIIMGVDLAKHQDFTVITGARESDRIPVLHDRFNEVSWPRQKEWIVEHYEELLRQGCSATLYVDATGIGDVIFDDLEEAGVDVEGVKFTNQWKHQAVKRLSADLERGEAHILDRQIGEFRDYLYEISGALYKYHAPEGKHDDEVSAKLLEHWGLTQGGQPNVRPLDGEGVDPDDEAEIEEPTEAEPIVADSPAAIMGRPGAWH